MASDVEEALATILAVDDLDERAVVLSRIEDSLHIGHAAAWKTEIESRVDEVLGGKVELVDAEETDRQIAAELAAFAE